MIFKIKKLIFGLFLQVKSLFRSFGDVCNIHLGDYVIYKKEIYFVNNGVSFPRWDLCKPEWDENGKRESVRVHQGDFKKIKSWKNLKHDLFFLHRWYMSNWYAIDLRRALER